jgi:predicted permease
MLETAMLASAGAVLGWWIATVATSALARQTGLGVPRFATVTLSSPVVACVSLAAVLVVLLCGAAPIVGVRQAQLATSLRAGSSTGSRQSRRFRGALVVAQLATAIVLLVGAGLLGRTLLVLTRADLGLSLPHQVLTMAVPVGESASAIDRNAQSAVLERVLADARLQPGVESAGLGSNLPPAAAQVMFTVRYVSGGRDETTKMDMVSATDGYLDALGARVVRGRLFQASDFESEQPVAVISVTAMRHLGLTEAVVDHDLNMQLPSASGTRVKPRVVGVIADVRYSGLDASANGGIYVLWRQIPMAQAYLVLRARGEPGALASAVSRIVRAADPSLPLASPRTLDAVIDDVLAPRHARFGLVGVYAVAAILLAVVGLSGALIRSVAERQRELAIRAAIGATPRDLVVAILRHGLLLAAMGAAIGMACALAAGRAAATVLFGVTPYDPMTYAVALATVLAIAGIASYWPARRAASANPVVLLRSE